MVCEAESISSTCTHCAGILAYSFKYNCWYHIEQYYGFANHQAISHPETIVEYKIEFEYAHDYHEGMLDGQM